MLAVGVLLSHDVHDPCRRHEREGHHRENDDQKRLEEVDIYLLVVCLCGRQTSSTAKNKDETKYLVS